MPSHRSGGGQLSTGVSGNLSVPDNVAPDGGSIADYPKGYRFLPSGMTERQREDMKKIPKAVEAMKQLHVLQWVEEFSTPPRDVEARKAEHHKALADVHYNMVIAPQIKAQEEQIAREKEEQSQAIATLKMRVQELEKPTPEPTPAVTSTISILPIIIVVVALIGILLFLRRRA